MRLGRHPGSFPYPKQFRTIIIFVSKVSGNPAYILCPGIILDAMSAESVQWTSHPEPSQCQSQPIWDRRANLWLYDLNSGTKFI
jgi:hypothetical protein